MNIYARAVGGAYTSVSKQVGAFRVHMVPLVLVSEQTDSQVLYQGVQSYIMALAAWYCAEVYAALDSH